MSNNSVLVTVVIAIAAYSIISDFISAWRDRGIAKYQAMQDQQQQNSLEDDR
jgi:hypothetical protein